jgi:hypothetical protein
LCSLVPSLQESVKSLEALNQLGQGLGFNLVPFGAEGKEFATKHFAQQIIGEIYKVKLPSHKGFRVRVSVARKWINSS